MHMDNDAKLILRCCCDCETAHRLFKNCLDSYNLMVKTWEAKPSVPPWAKKQIEELNYVKNLLRDFLSENRWV